MSLHRRTAPGAGLVLALAVAACGAETTRAPAGWAPVPSPAAASSTSATGLSVTVRQYRRDAADRVVQLTVTNTGDEAVSVAGAALDAPQFAPHPSVPKDSRVPPGRRVDLPVPLGEARCGAGAAGGAAVAVLALAGDGPGVGREHPLPLADDDGLLERIRGRECAERELAEAVDLALTGPWETGVRADGLAVVRGALRLQRRQDGPAVAVEDVGRSVLFTVDTGTAVPRLALPPGEADAAVRVELAAGRCDAHALAESKKSYTFPVAASLDGRPVASAVTADDEARRMLDGLVRATCLRG